MATAAVVALLVTLAVTVSTTGAFNLDTHRPMIRSFPGHDAEAMFGFTVALHRHRHAIWLLVGAPGAQTRQPSVTKGGAVYACAIDRSTCHLLDFDSTGPSPIFDGRAYVTIEQKSHQWFGGSLASSSETGAIVACAPRYVFFTENMREREPVGSCWLKHRGRTVEISPCRQPPYGYQATGYCQAGFSVAMSKAGDLLIGAVGSYYWQGQVFQRNIFNNKTRHKTTERPISDDNTYMGFAIAVGQFDGDSREDFAVSSPKAEKHRGRVDFFTMQMNNIFNISGEQIGEYFGYSLTVADFNSDGLDDIAVGAPFYSDYAGGYECGRVYVFYQTIEHTFDEKSKTRLSGASDKSPARFGLSVARIGDSDLDGYEDLAVGAPYGGENGRGAVYVFRGSNRGLKTVASQTVFAQQIGLELSTFGFSLSGGLDMDANGYRDLSVGAYKSNSVVLLWSRPVIRMKVEVSTTPSVINLERRECFHADQTAALCFSMKTCLTFSGLSTPEKIDIELSWQLDYRKSSNAGRRAFFTGRTLPNDGNSSVAVTRRHLGVTVHNTKRLCLDHSVHLKDEFTDKLAPIGIQVNYTLIDGDRLNRLRRSLTPVMESASIMMQVNIYKFCGADDICIPDLAIIAKSKTERHLVGTSAEVVLAVRVRNNGEASYETVVTILLPPGVAYINVHKGNSNRPLTCSSPSDHQVAGGSGHVVCNVGNPLPANKTVRFRLRLLASQIDTGRPLMTFHLNVNSSNPENSTDELDNAVSVDVPVVVLTDIRISGVSRPGQVFHVSHVTKPQQTDVELGPEVTHLYEVRNTGPSEIRTLSVDIDWPVRLLYLHTAPLLVRGRGSCHAPDVNPLNLSVVESLKAEKMFSGVAFLDQMNVSSSDHRQRRATTDDLPPPVKARLLSLGCEGSPMVPCVLIRCEIEEMERDASVIIQVRARVNVAAVTEMDDGVVTVTSRATARVNDVPYDLKPTAVATHTFQVTTVLTALEPPSKRRPIQIWIIVVGIVGGWCLLLLLVALLWRCGFFERNKTAALNKATLSKQDDPVEGNENNCLYSSVPNNEF